jgi:putative ABC transport system permease protein
VRKLRELILRFGGLFNKQRKDLELNEEIESHLQMHIDDNLRLGMTPEEARRQAMIKLGGIESTKEAYRDQRGLPLLETLWQDVRYGARMLRRNPGFTAAAVLTLALGIGATTAIFSLINAVLLEPLPYEQPGQLVYLWETRENKQPGDVSPGAFMNWRDQSSSLEGVSAIREASANLTGTGQPERINGLRVSANFLSILRERPEVGRGFFSEEERVGGGDKVVVLSHGLWQRRFGGDTNLIGKLIQLDGEGYLMVGVLRANALATEPQVDFLVPFGWHRHYGSHNLRVIGRLKPGFTAQQARAELAAIKERMQADYPKWKEAWSVAVVPMHEEVTGEVKPTLLILLGAVGCVLLVACANVANLLLSRAVARQREMAVRTALGASRWRTIRQVLTESVLLSTLGGVLGVSIAFGGVRTLLAWNEGPVRHLAEAHVDARMLGFALFIALGTGVGFGIFPALRLSGLRLDPVLKEGGRGVVASSRGRLQSGLIIAEIALALMLLTGAGLLMRSFAKLMSVSPGFVAQHALAMDLSIPDTKYPSASAKVEFMQRVVDQMSAVPGVETAGYTWNRPMRGIGSDERSMRVVGRQYASDQGYGVKYEGVAGDCFRALGVPLLKGRTFLRADYSTSAAPVVVCSETLARRVFSNEEPIGKYVQFDKDERNYEIVGMVGDIRLTELLDDRLDRIYFPQVGGNGSLFVRTRVAPASLVEPIRKSILQIDADQPVSNVRTLEQDISRSVNAKRQTLTLLGFFAVVALGLAALGLYGVLAHAVALRRQEIGIRMALGAQRKDVLRLILRNGMRLTLVGVVLGLVGAFGLTRVLRNQLYQVGTTDPLTFAVVALPLGLVAFFACLIPARRATKVDPMVALRHD